MLVTLFGAANVTLVREVQPNAFFPIVVTFSGIVIVPRTPQ